MLVKTLVLNGNGRVYQIVRNLIQRRPLPVLGRMDSLKKLNIAVMIHIIYIGSLIDAGIVQTVVGLGQNVVLQVGAQNPDEHKSTDDSDQKNRCGGSNGNLQNRQAGRPGSIEQLQNPVGIPRLSGFVSFSRVVHKIILHDIGRKAGMVKQSGESQCAWA